MYPRRLAFASSFLIVASLRSISGASSVVSVVSSDAIVLASTCFLFVRHRLGFGRSFIQRRRTGTFPGHLPESRLDFQLSLPQPLLLGERAFRIGLEAGRGRRDRMLERRPLDQQRDRFGQILAGRLRIGSFYEEGEARAVRRRREGSRAGYGSKRAAFKAFAVVEQGI